ncbi:MAG: DUF3822 family protein [Flavobacteriales bacterium]|nr:DUF3822 family protein [Flavobacteriales bacterium]
MASLIRKEFHLKADNEQEATNGRLSSFIDVSRSGVQLLKVNSSFKAIEFISWSFPHSSTDSVWAERIAEILKNGELNEVASTKFSISDNQVVIVPETLFSETEKEKYFNFLFDSSEESEIVTQKLTNTDAVGLFSIPKSVKEVLKEAVSSSFLTWTDSILGNSSGTKVYLVLDEKQFSLSILKDGKLIFSNWFQFSKEDDVLYFLMATLESLNILHSEIELLMGGFVEKGDETFKVLSRFISKISFIKRPKNLTYSYSFNHMAEHRFPFILAAACA